MEYSRLTDDERLEAEAAFAQRLNVIHHAYVDVAGDLVAGALLGQICYWFGTGKDGRPRARIVKDGHLWIAKARTDWWDEIRISAKQYDRAAKILKERGYIEVKTMKFAGNPTTHIRLCAPALLAALEAWKVGQVKRSSTDGGKPATPDSAAPQGVPGVGAVGFNPMGDNVLPHGVNPYSPTGGQGVTPSGDSRVPESSSSFTETPAENTQESTQENTHTQEAAAPPVGETAALGLHRSTVEQIEKDFEAVWSEYPRKEGRAKARRAFEKAVRGIGTRKHDGSPWTAAEIMAEVVLYRQHIERRVESGDLERRYIPTGGAWFEREGWTDEIPSISSTFDDFDQGLDYNRGVVELRRCAAMIDRAPEPERPPLWDKLRSIRQAFPY